MRLARSVLLFNAGVACAFSLAGCELVLDPNSLVGKEANAGHSGTLVAGGAGADAGGGDSLGGGGTSAGGAGANGGASAGGAGAPSAGSGGSSICKPSNKGKEICDGVDNDCNPATPDCPMNCTFFSARGIRYMACNKVVKWQNAQLACLLQNMNLVQVNDGPQNAALLAELQALGIGPYVWLGADDTGGNGLVEWPNGATIADGTKPAPGIYTNFSAGEPAIVIASNGSGRCVQMDTADGAGAGKWSATLCTDTQQYVCEPFADNL